MAYAQESELRDRLGSELIRLLADEDGDGSGDPSLLQASLDDAAAEIDAGLAGRYVTPVDPAPGILRRLAVDLAVHYLFVRRREAISPEHVDRAAAARAFLGDIARGYVELDGAAARLRRFKSESSTRGQEKRFDRDGLEPF